MYTSLIVLMIGIAAILGSWLALAPAFLIGALFVVRTTLEDRMLTKELAGYSDYAGQVTERLLPEVW
jgi:protein-S-isoprenylcysteine O-methyltransferase Ste14